MKSYESELDEMIDGVIKLTWSYTVFRALFEKKAADLEAREAHPEFFLTMYDCLFCQFCVMTSLLFEDEKKKAATSLTNLVKQANPALQAKWTEKIRGNKSVKGLKAMRHQFCAHRFREKTPQDVFDEVMPLVSMMAEVVDLGRSIILELAEAAGAKKREQLERQQLSEETLRCLADDTGQVMITFLKPFKH